MLHEHKQVQMEEEGNMRAFFWNVVKKWIGKKNYNKLWYLKSDLSFQLWYL